MFAIGRRVWNCAAFSARSAVVSSVHTTSARLATGEAAIRINHYGHAPLTEQNHTYIGAGEKLVDDHWAASLAQF